MSNVRELAFPHQRCWGRSPCPGRSAPGSHVVPQLPLRLPPSPALPIQRNGGGAGPAGLGRGRVRKRTGPLSSAARVRLTTPQHLRGFRHRRFRAAMPMSDSDLHPPCPAMAASRASRRQRGRRREGRCHRMSQWRTAGWRRSLQGNRRRN